MCPHIHTQFCLAVVGWLEVFLLDRGRECMLMSMHTSLGSTGITSPIPSTGGKCTSVWGGCIGEVCMSVFCDSGMCDV